MKTKAQRKDIREKDDLALVSTLAEHREAIRASRFGRAANPTKGGVNPAALRKAIARIETERTVRRAAAKKSA